MGLGKPHANVGELLASLCRLSSALCAGYEDTLVLDDGIRLRDGCRIEDAAVLVIEGGGTATRGRLFSPRPIGVGVGASLLREMVLGTVEALRAVCEGVGRTVLAGPRGFGAAGARPIRMRWLCELHRPQHRSCTKVDYSLSLPL